MKPAEIRRLHQKKGREEAGRFLIEGEHLVLELERAAARDARLRESQVYVTAAQAGRIRGLPVEVVTEREMTLVTETRAPQGLVAVVPLLAPPPPRPGERAIYLHGIQDPGNLGTILRTLAWFGGFRCLLGPDSVDPHNGKAVRASMGAIFHVPVEADVALDALPARYARIACLDLRGEPVTSPAFRDFDCYVFGSEAQGLPRAALQALGARAFTIPGTGVIESLNVATSVSLCQYELHRLAP